MLDPLENALSMSKIIDKNITPALRKLSDLKQPISSDHPELACRMAYTMSVREAVALMDQYQISFFYRRKDILKKSKYVRTSDNNMPPPSAGSDVWVCKCSGFPPSLKGPRKRNRSSRRCGCTASFRINFKDGYFHCPDNSINVKDFGDKKVSITWDSTHVNHVFNCQKEFAKSPASKQARDTLAYVVSSLGIDWPQIKKMQRMESSRKGTDMVSELQKFKYDQWYYQKNKGPKKAASRNENIELSLRSWAEGIKSLGGIAEFEDKFSPLYDENTKEDMTTNEGSKVWCFFFMTDWQKTLIRENSEIFYLDATHKTSFGLHKNENMYLFTIVVKNHITGTGAPAAFMLTNGSGKSVIAHFLRTLKRLSQFNPRQALVDCDEAGTSAINSVWEFQVPVTYCRFHVLKAFREEVNKNLGGTANKKVLAHNIQKDFASIIYSRTKEEVGNRILAFEAKYASNESITEYTRNQWFSKLEYCCDAFNDFYVKGRDTNNLIETYHRVLKGKFLARSKMQTPDLLAYKLLSFVVPMYVGAEKRTLYHYRDRYNDIQETSAKQKASEILLENMQEMILPLFNGCFNVTSFTDDVKHYSVTTQFAGNNKDSCTCHVHSNSGELCKHLFLVRRWWDTQELL